MLTALAILGVVLVVGLAIAAIRRRPLSTSVARGGHRTHEPYSPLWMPVGDGGSPDCGGGDAGGGCDGGGGGGGE
jgi:hypothetical protein